MKAELKAMWLEALRSGKYGQATKSLHDPDSNNYCCLGVLAHVVGISDTALDDCTSGFLIAQVGGDHGLGPWKLDGDREYWPEMPESHTTTQRKLAAQNDVGKSFAEIADWIETNVAAE